MFDWLTDLITNPVETITHLIEDVVEIINNVVDTVTDGGSTNYTTYSGGDSYNGAGDDADQRGADAARRDAAYAHQQYLAEESQQFDQDIGQQTEAATASDKPGSLARVEPPSQEGSTSLDELTALFRGGQSSSGRIDPLSGQEIPSNFLTLDDFSILVDFSRWQLPDDPVQLLTSVQTLVMSPQQIAAIGSLGAAECELEGLAMLADACDSPSQFYLFTSPQRLIEFGDQEEEAGDFLSVWRTTWSTIEVDPPGDDGCEGCEPFPIDGIDSGVLIDPIPEDLTGTDGCEDCEPFPIIDWGVLIDPIPEDLTGTDGCEGCEPPAYPPEFGYHILASGEADEGEGQQEGQPTEEVGEQETVDTGETGEEPEGIVNTVGQAYPEYIDLTTGEPIPFPEGPLVVVPREDRVPWDLKLRGEYIKEWYDRGNPDPPLPWADYDIHHIQPRQYGGTNDFENLVPVERQIHQDEFNTFWQHWEDEENDDE
jgi:hypothetical protein